MSAGPLPPLAGLVLAGGRSARLGEDKAALQLAGASLLERAVKMLATVTSDVHVGVRRDQLDEPLRARFTCLEDVASDLGPAAGLLAAHRARPEAAWLVLACDMPYVRPATLALLVAGRDAGRGATAFRGADGRPEPLCAIYEPANLAAFRRQVEAGGNPSPRDWLVAARAPLLDSGAPGVFSSINTAADLERLRGNLPTPPLARR